MMTKTTKVTTTELNKVTVGWQEIVDYVKEKYKCNYWIQNADLYVEIGYGEKGHIDDEHPVIVEWEEVKIEEKNGI